LTSRRAVVSIRSVLAPAVMVAVALSLSPAVTLGHGNHPRVARPHHTVISSRKSDNRRMLTEQQIIANLGLTGTRYGASLMSYAEAQAQHPELAAAAPSIVDPITQVWVITRYYPKPVTEPVGSVPAGVPATASVSSESWVIDAVSGHETDGCINCPVIPAS